jgi:predicted phosphate transport protein (TIGR00153 family)
MLRWFQAMMPREAGFFDMFDRHAGTLVLGADALSRMLKGETPVAEGCASIVQHENEADAITREVLLAVRRTFVTPFDRSDIKDLITSLDDAIDQMQKTAKAVTLFEVDTFEEPMKQMGEIIVTSAQRTVEAVGLLRDMRRNTARLNAVTEEVTHLEEQADMMHDTGLKALFKAHRHDDPMAYIVGMEIYDHLEKVMDRFEDVANRISGIVIEHM